MAADHRRKRLNGASIVGCSSWEQNRSKKKKLASPISYMNLKSHVSLEWDGNQKQVVAKGEQIGISKRDLRLFIDSVHRSHNVLADVFTVPRDIFELDDLRSVLSYKVWQTHLSEKERKFLMQFLPRGLEGEDVVRALLGGDNFHFGNPCLEWGASVCSGGSHPDAVILKEQHLKENRKAYYMEIQKYHDDMIEYLQMVKKMQESSDEPDKEFLENIWRSRRVSEKTATSFANEYRCRDPEENVAATSESCSLVAEEIACSSDNQNSPVMSGGEFQNRVYEKGLMKENSKKPMISSFDARATIGDKLPKRNIHQSDGAKYMSFLKISKKQHQLVTNMKPSGKGIHSKSLNHVLGNIDKLHVQPYGEFVKEEQKKLQLYWLELARKDLPAAYANWRGRQHQKQEITKSLEHEMKGKLKSPLKDEDRENHERPFFDKNELAEKEHEFDMENEHKESHGTVFLDKNDREPTELEAVDEDDKKENPHTLVFYQNDQEANDNESSDEDRGTENGDTLYIDQNDQGGKVHESNNEDKDKENHDAVLLNQNYQEAEEHEYRVEDKGDVNHGTLVFDQNGQGAEEHDYTVEDDTKENHNSMFQDENEQGARDQESNVEDVDNSGSGSLDHHSRQLISSNGGDVNPIDMDSQSNNVPSKSGDTSPNISDYSGNANTADASFSQGVPISSGGNVWSAVSLPHSYYGSPTNQEYASTRGLSLPHQVNEEQQAQLIDLESNVHEGNIRKDLLHGQSYGSFSSYPNHDRSGLLQSLFKGHGLPYHHGQKQTGLTFQSPNNMLMEDGPYTGHLRGQQLQPSLSLEQGQKRHGEGYIQQHISGDIYSEGGGYLISSRGHVPPPVNVQSWPANPVRISAQHQSHITNDGLLHQNWFPGEHQIRAGWTNSDCGGIPSQNIGSHGDQSLFSILPPTEQLSSPFDSMSSTEQFMLPRNYGMVNGNYPRMDASLPQAAAHPLDYLNGRETATALMSDDMGWMSLPQNSALHDAMGKPFLRSWNQ